MSSCITRSGAVWNSGDAKSRELLDDAFDSTIGLPKVLSKIVVDYLEDFPCFGESE